MTTTCNDDLADELERLVAELYPICRSITGDGVRATLDILRRLIPLEVHEVPSGTTVLDWVVPDEWNIRDAFVTDSSGRRVIDFRRSNLHVVSYSIPVDERMSLDELRPHLHTLPDQPDLVPYRTSYYEPQWGFCLSERAAAALQPGEYHVRIDSTLRPGFLTYGELVVLGTTASEVLVSAHTCHPSLCDDNLSGIAVAAAFARRLAAGPPPRHTFRFLFAPGTIGAITWLARNRDRAHLVAHGLTLTCLGDAHPFTYKCTADGNRAIDRAAALALRGREHEIIDFFPYGYDERQYNSPGFRLPVGSLMRGRHGRFPEYHTSADDVSFVSGAHMVDSLDVLATIADIVDRDRVLRSRQPFGEPQLGRRGLYHAIGGTDLPDAQHAMLWLLNQADGEHTLVDVAERSGIPFTTLDQTADMLAEHELVEVVER